MDRNPLTDWLVGIVDWPVAVAIVFLSTFSLLWLACLSVDRLMNPGSPESRSEAPGPDRQVFIPGRDETAPDRDQELP